MTEDDIILLNAQSLADTMPDRWWIPTADLLAAIEPGHTQVRLLAVEPDPDGGADLWDARSVWLAVEARDGEELSGYDR